MNPTRILSVSVFCLVAACGNSIGPGTEEDVNVDRQITAHDEDAASGPDASADSTTADSAVTADADAEVQTAPDAADPPDSDPADAATTQDAAPAPCGSAGQPCCQSSSFENGTDPGGYFCNSTADQWLECSNYGNAQEVVHRCLPCGNTDQLCCNPVEHPSYMCNPMTNGNGPCGYYADGGMSNDNSCH